MDATSQAILASTTSFAWIGWLRRRLGRRTTQSPAEHCDHFHGHPQTGSAKAIFTDQDAAWVDVPESGSGAGHRIDGFDWLIDGQELSLVERARRVAPTLRPSRAFAASRPWPSLPKPPTPWALRPSIPESHWVYFMASPENATQRYLYRSLLDRSAAAVRLTPMSSTRDALLQHLARLPVGISYLLPFDSPPVIDLVSLPEHTSVRVLEDNEALRANVASSLDPPVEFVQFRLADGVTVDGWLLKPRDFDPAKKYPADRACLRRAGGRPVVDTWMGPQTLFHRALADDGYLVASFDNRGTPAPKGRAWRKASTAPSESYPPRPD